MSHGHFFANTVTSGPEHYGQNSQHLSGVGLELSRHESRIRSSLRYSLVSFKEYINRPKREEEAISITGSSNAKQGITNLYFSNAAIFIDKPTKEEIELRGFLPIHAHIEVCCFCYCFVVTIN